MKKFASILFASALLAGCQSNMGSSSYYGDPSHDAYYQPQRASAAPMQYHGAPAQLQQVQQPAIQQNMVPAYQADPQTQEHVANLMERVRRIERAMIRLDRRMQLVERNELSRMTSGIMSGAEGAEPAGSFQPMSYPNAPQGVNQPARLPAVNAQNPNPYMAPSMPQQQPNRGGYQPVSFNQNDGFITSSLGVAPKRVNTAAQPVQTSAFSGMPSLADEASKSKESASVSIWTVEYESGKVWPGREQLTASREVVRTLAGKEPVAIYARGAKPSSKEFRERVRALSKYLAKVTQVDDVPIASMPAQHMSGDTIEIIVTK